MEEFKVKIYINAYEKSLIDELVEKRGFRKEQIFQLAIRLLHKKEFPAYLKPLKHKPKRDEALTEESCLSQGGEVIIDNGQRYCQLQYGGMTVKKLLQ